MESTLVTHDLLSCAKCTRLRDYISRVKPSRKFAGQKYWSRPVPGFGDPKAKLVVVGLAPAAHGGNRTGRPFTGDESGKWVVKGLHELGLANREESVSRDDGLELKRVYLTNAVKCAPPKNRPTREEVENCSHWLSKELNELREAKVI
ncbi:MAG: uracil-DNA glycosylase family protein, partial [Infirmifilum sp.]